MLGLAISCLIQYSIYVEKGYNSGHGRKKIIKKGNEPKGLVSLSNANVKRCNFRKAKWKQFAHLVESEVGTLPSPSTPNTKSMHSLLPTAFPISKENHKTWLPPAVYPNMGRQM